MKKKKENEQERAVDVIDFHKREYYLNRECTWLKFNQRVLRESLSKENPLLERLRFIAITCSNLDEFFMIRVAGLKHLLESGIDHHDISGLTPRGQMEAVSCLAHNQIHDIDRCLRLILAELKGEGIHFISPTDLTRQQELWLTEFFEREIYPIVTPMAVDPSHPFPFLASKSLNLAVHLKRHEEEDIRLAILPVPSAILGRLIKLPDTLHFLYLEDVLSYFASRFFTGYEILETTPFRITRDADLDIREDVDDLLTEVEKSLEKRRKGAAVRLEIAKSTSAETRQILQKELELEDGDIYTIQGPLGAAFFSSFANIEGFDHLRYKPFIPRPSIELAARKAPDIWKAIREGDILLHHPFESFHTVEQFIHTAAYDDNVLAIKQTLYRVSSKSPIIAALAAAARNGKQVTVLMEVKARFDEENNILMARLLEEAGCHVIYGILGLKTHSKITMVIRREEDGIRRYCHLATGNYNGSTAKIYTDVGLLTCDNEIGMDGSRFFNFLSGFSDPPVWNKLIVAPLNLRETIMAEIDQEIRHAQNGEKAYIAAKMNSLLDRFLIAKLYEASAAGVKIDLIVRGICVLRPGIKGVSENIHVRSIVGRFLEHSRILYFRNGGKDDVFISSADWMPRNLNNRVELMIPVAGKAHKRRLRAILNTYIKDNKKAYLMRSDGSYVRASCRKGSTPVAAQNFLMETAIKGEVLGQK
ncbi:polyphosphate kinase 1 [Mitsuokella sp. AF21-1AC]|uniref:polyphosphate kinase 1 n=1 Tax=Mitsuokella sp. AF21-1AC TaxID=2292235 RepID=UPI000E4C3182|nr:polyphosphate kinase 1 [Mitsuokella sp. AF21-1AC]RGS73474.1 polyphosphate kinase 1 [Mitsuokella sp. AF21-1AC]